MIKGVNPSRKGAGNALKRVLGCLVVISIFSLLAAGGVHSGEPVDEPRTEPIKGVSDTDLRDDFDRDSNPGIYPDPEPVAVLPGEVFPSFEASVLSSPEWTPRELRRSIVPSWVAHIKLIALVAVH